jgi:hypothetical protein
MNSYYVGSDTNNLQKKMFSFSSVSEYLDEFNKMPFLYKKKKKRYSVLETNIYSTNNIHKYRLYANLLKTLRKNI